MFSFTNTHAVPWCVHSAVESFTLTLARQGILQHYSLRMRLARLVHMAVKTCPATPLCIPLIGTCECL